MDQWRTFIRLTQPVALLLNCCRSVPHRSRLHWLTTSPPSCCIGLTLSVVLSIDTRYLPPEALWFTAIHLTTVITRSSSTAEKQRVSCPHGGGRPSNALHSTPLRPFWLHLCIWSNPKPATNVRQACRPLSALLDESGIQGHSRSSLLVPAGIQNGVLT